MTPEEQRIALAEWDGWVEVYAPVDWMPGELTGIYTFPHPTDPEKIKYYVSRKPVPDYLNDLNAVHLLEMKLPKPKLPQDYWNVGYGRFKTILSNITSEPYSATATQRCEALLKTLNLWKP